MQAGSPHHNLSWRARIVVQASSLRNESAGQGCMTLYACIFYTPTAFFNFSPGLRRGAALPWVKTSVDLNTLKAFFSRQLRKSFRVYGQFWDLTQGSAVTGATLG